MSKQKTYQAVLFIRHDMGITTTIPITPQPTNLEEAVDQLHQIMNNAEILKMASFYICSRNIIKAKKVIEIIQDSGGKVEPITQQYTTSSATLEELDQLIELMYGINSVKWIHQRFLTVYCILTKNPLTNRPIANQTVSFSNRCNKYDNVTIEWATKTKGNKKLIRKKRIAFINKILASLDIPSLIDDDSGKTFSQSLSRKENDDFKWSCTHYDLNGPANVSISLKGKVRALDYYYRLKSKYSFNINHISAFSKGSFELIEALDKFDFLQGQGLEISGTSDNTILNILPELLENIDNVYVSWQLPINHGLISYIDIQFESRNNHFRITFSSKRLGDTEICEFIEHEFNVSFDYDKMFIW